MLNVADTKAAPWHKPDLLTHGIPLERIKGLHRAEQYSLDESAARCERETKEKYSHEEIFGKWCNVNAFIDVPVDFAFAYVANIFSLEEWTYNVRDLKHLTNGVYKGRALHTNTEFFVRSEVFKDARVVDYQCACDQKEELWMRYNFRFLDAEPSIKRPGTILTWLNSKHPYYDRQSKNLPGWLKDAQNRTDRPWVGDHWPYFYAAHKIEADNLRFILEHRYYNRK